MLVVTNREKEFADIPARYPGKIIVDLVRMWDTLDYDGHYDGLAWAPINTNSAQSAETGRDFCKCRF